MKVFRLPFAIVLVALLLFTALMASERQRREVADPRAADRLEASRRPAATQEADRHGDRAMSVPEIEATNPVVGGAAIPDGLGWLISNQDPSGSWGSTFEYSDTATAVDLLARTQPLGLPFVSGTAWLTGNTAGDLDELSRQILALQHVEGLDIDDLVDTLFGARNAAESNPAVPNFPEGGWGLREGFETDSLTTALALLALEATGRKAGIGVENEALAPSSTNVHEWEIAPGATKARIVITISGSEVRLRMTEGAPPTPADPFFSLPAGFTFEIVLPDSGLPFTAGTNFISIESPNPPGLAATYSFTASFETPDFDTRAFAEALGYLRQAQNMDGGWGIQTGDATSLFTTLHVMLALQQYRDYDFDDELAAAEGYLLGQQNVDGSFGVSGIGIPYMTALAAMNLTRIDVCAFTTPTEDAINALLGMQAPDGSWVQEPFDTGLALRALWEYDKDGDGVFEDGDCSGTAGDNPCAPGMTLNCDDTCADYFNLDQQPVIFGQNIEAPDQNSLIWPNPVDVAYVMGDLSQISTYTVLSGGVAPFSIFLSTFGDEPAPGTGFWYLMRLAGDCMNPSWQTSLGAEPGRDAAMLGEIDVFITDPADGAVLTSSPATVSGTVTGSEPVSVDINGVAAIVGGGSFSADVPLVRGANTITANGTDAAGFMGSAQISVTLVDYSLGIGGMVVDSRIFTADSVVLDQAAFFTENQIGVPAGVIYTTLSVQRISATEMQITFQIDITGATSPGIHFFQVEYGLLDAGSNPLGPLNGNLFDFQIQVTP